ncbi:hypothetical protein B7494_g6961 [Chlorociboria aeruginascens]|nr:hypothetical protein B7494_g6961 [Chlorociboria aeruginascens]
MCRSRRIKCDETKPTCMACLRSKRVCPGYKDDFDIIFRDETKSTEKRWRTSKNLNLANSQRSDQTAFPNDSTKGHTVRLGDAQHIMDPAEDSANLFLPEGLVVPVDQQAPCYFLSNYVITPRSSTTRGYFDFIIPIIKSEGPDSHFSVAFQAVSMASLANRPNIRGRSNIMRVARSQYMKALKTVNLALQSPVDQKSDQTLAAIIMLGFFETITLVRSGNRAWSAHVDGAAQLVKLRGRKQLRTKIGHALFVTVRSQMIINCASTSNPPVLGTDWWLADYKEFPKDEAGNVATKLHLRLLELRAEVKDVLAAATATRTLEYREKVVQLIGQAKEIEQAFQIWEDSLSEHSKAKTAIWVDNIPGLDLSTMDFYPGKVDMFEDLFVASALNQVRVSRISIAGLIIRLAAWVCSPSDYRTTPEYAANASDFVTDSQRQWVKGRLKFISDALGMNQAHVLSPPASPIHNHYARQHGTHDIPR